MHFDGELALSLFDLFIAGAALDAQDFIVIAFGHGGVVGRLSGLRPG